MTETDRARLQGILDQAEDFEDARDGYCWLLERLRSVLREAATPAEPSLNPEPHVEALVQARATKGATIALLQDRAIHAEQERDALQVLLDTRHHSPRRNDHG